MLYWKEFSAWVTIDDKEAAEYDVETSEDERIVTCWIASELGKKFSICWRNSSLPRDVAGYVKVDGNACGGKVSYHRTDLGRTHPKSGVTDGTTLKPFVFSSLELSDDDALLGTSSFQDLGLIELAIKPVHVMGLTDLPIYSLSDLKVHERLKKAVTQQIALAEPEALKQPVRCVKVLPTGPEFVKFHFKYRPIDVLRANGIAPSSPPLKRKASAEPPRAQTPEDSEKLADLEKVKVLREELRALEAKVHRRERKPRIKNEVGAAIDLTPERSRNKRVKLEPRQSFFPGEVIDLT
ncbi:hypothetical protein MVEN_00829500 [Mycena venus]|uniref:DUF7918 domain-containing protein n=1 Tax=Mycena venus TaxID=2733690 RepID=A0A8H7D0V2_9AGAR|nr:hypothetical protein MVEN_00829500 [Mycena venus]